jgi:hypothetical protein
MKKFTGQRSSIGESFSVPTGEGGSVAIGNDHRHNEVNMTNFYKAESPEPKILPSTLHAYLYNVIYCAYKQYLIPYG